VSAAPPQPTLGGIMTELLGFISQLVYFYEIIVFAAVLVQILIQNGMITYTNPMVRSIHQGLQAVTEPVLRLIRGRLPKSSRASGLDFSPIVLIVICWFIRLVLLPNIAKAF
jgi:YggT family protein